MAMDSSQRRSYEWLCKRGVELLESGDRLRALSTFEMAYELKQTPEIRSFYGMLAATERGLIKTGIELCNSSIEDDPSNPIHYINLSKLLYSVERKSDAVDVMLKASTLGPSEEVSKWIRVVGLRKRPVFPFLARSNTINKYTGLILRRLGLR